jgi:hypothetical protein
MGLKYACVGSDVSSLGRSIDEQHTLSHEGASSTASRAIRPLQAFLSGGDTRVI